MWVKVYRENNQCDFCDTGEESFGKWMGENINFGAHLENAVMIVRVYDN